MKCSNYREEFEVQGIASGEFTSHSLECADCAQYLKEDSALTELIGELPKREAPADFGVAVRSRIQRRKSGPSGFWSVARIAVPAAAMILIVGFVVMNSDLFINDSPKLNDTAVKLDKRDTTGDEAPVLQEENAGEPVSPKESIPVAESNSELAAGDREVPNGPSKDEDQEARKDIPVKKKESLSSIDSTDQAFEEVETTNPPGLDPDKKLEDVKRPEKRSFTDREILRALGMNTVWNGSRLMVTSVTRNSVAQRSGVRTGDRILSIDGRAVSKGSVGSAKAQALALRVMRKGKALNLSIR